MGGEGPVIEQDIGSAHRPICLQPDRADRGRLGRKSRILGLVPFLTDSGDASGIKLVPEARKVPIQAQTC